MCGIAGLLGADPGAGERVERMITRQHHRGPDDRHLVRIATGGLPLVLGFNRLAILDLSLDARQPMHDPASGSWLVFNGEIYNFAALRHTLEGDGRRFRSRGDTEVLLAALATWGMAALPRLRGMYAFAFYDAPRRRLLLGRDGFGIKPLLYARLGGSFAFASEFRALRAGLGPLTLDPAALHGYLTFGAVPEPHTMAREVRVVSPGHVLEVSVDDGAERLHDVVRLADDLREPAERAPRSLAQVVDEMTATLEGAVESHLVSDVPVGVLLSGGIDSAVVASLVPTRTDLRPPTLLTVGFDEDAFSEVAGARAMAARVGGRHEVVPIRDHDLLGALPGLLDAMDQPTADGVNTYVVARAAADRGIKVLLSGVGGDELFGGYTTFRKAPLLAAHAGWLAPLSGLALRLGLGRSGPWEKLSAAGAVKGLRDAYLLQRSIGMPAAGAADAGYGLSRPASEQLRIPVGASAFHAVSWLETSFYLRNQLLRDADVMSAAHSIELRVPFVDREVLRAAWAVPADMHMGRLTGRKRVLRAVLERWHGGRVGRGPKRGFVFPWRAWMQGPLGKQMAATLGDRGGLEALGLPPELGVRALAACGRGASDVPWMQPWSLFALLEWNRRVGLAA